MYRIWPTANAPIARLGWTLLMLGLLGEGLAWRAYFLSRYFAMGGFVIVDWTLIVAGTAPVGIGLALLLKRKPSGNDRRLPRWGTCHNRGWAVRRFHAFLPDPHLEPG